jgi:hypothetical protein
MSALAKRRPRTYPHGFFMNKMFALVTLNAFYSSYYSVSIRSNSISLLLFGIRHYIIFLSTCSLANVFVMKTSTESLKVFCHLLTFSFTQIIGNMM